MLQLSRCCCKPLFIFHIYGWRWHKTKRVKQKPRLKTHGFSVVSQCTCCPLPVQPFCLQIVKQCRPCMYLSITNVLAIPSPNFVRSKRYICFFLHKDFMNKFYKKLCSHSNFVTTATEKKKHDCLEDEWQPFRVCAEEVLLLTGI